MTTANPVTVPEFGIVTGPGQVRFQRLLPGPVERVWEFLTDPVKRGLWLAPGSMDLRVGGKVELRFRHADLSSEKEYPARFKHVEHGHVSSGTIVRCEPPRLLAYTWGEESGTPSEVEFELTPRAQQVLLIVTHSRLATRNNMVGVSGGWHTHLGILEDQLNNREPRPFWTTHATVDAEYQERIPR